MVTIEDQQTADLAAIEVLLDTAFGPDRLAKTSYGYRQGIPPVAGLSLVARDGDRLIGTIRYWPVTVGAAAALLLGPIAVAPARRGEGIAARLINDSLARAKAAGHGLVLLVGDETLYRRHGFGRADRHGITMPGEAPRRLLLRALVDRALIGVRGPVGAWRGLRGVA